MILSRSSLTGDGMFKLIITEYKNNILTALYEDKNMIEVSLDNKEALSFIGNIYIGRVEKIVKSINAAFVEISKDFKGYYSLTENTDHIFLNEKNTDKVCEGDLILVQVEKEPVKTKAMVLTSKINMPGKYVVLSANDRGINVSRKINDKALVKEIKAALKEYCSDEDGFGLIARTNCEGLEDMTVLKKEAERITENYRDILRRARYLKAYTNMYSENSGFLKNIQNIRNSELEEIVTDIAVVYEQILACGLIEPQKIRLYKDELLPLSKLYSVENQMKDLLKERVWLKSGGYLVINPTEALTVIDVNTGKYIGDSKGRNPEIKKEEGFYKVNVEAAVEIARQIRLRNYSGIIIIDFIDMKDKEHNERLIEILSDEIKKDPVQTSFVDITKLGLVELTRKKIKRPVHELIT